VLIIFKNQVKLPAQKATTADISWSSNPGRTVGGGGAFYEAAIRCWWQGCSGGACGLQAAWVAGANLKLKPHNVALTWQSGRTTHSVSPVLTKVLWSIIWYEILFRWHDNKRRTEFYKIRGKFHQHKTHLIQLSSSQSR
jgi:hypothetical protein